MSTSPTSTTSRESGVQLSGGLPPRLGQERKRRRPFSGSLRCLELPGGDTVARRGAWFPTTTHSSLDASGTSTSPIQDNSRVQRFADPIVTPVTTPASGTPPFHTGQRAAASEVQREDKKNHNKKTFKKMQEEGEQLPCRALPRTPAFPSQAKPPLWTRSSSPAFAWKSAMLSRVYARGDVAGRTSKIVKRAITAITTGCRRVPTAVPPDFEVDPNTNRRIEGSNKRRTGVRRFLRQHT